MSIGKVVVIGLDGATFTLLKPWMESGQLPYLKSLMDDGVHAFLQSSVPPVTSPAWQSFMTGKNPGKHGAMCFLGETPGNGQQASFNATDYEGKPLWDLLSEDGKRVIVLNVPFTSPAAGMNGIMIGGFDTPPSRQADFASPPGLLQAIEDKFGAYKFHIKPLFLLYLGLADPALAIEAFLRTCEEFTDYQFQVAEYLVDHNAFDFLMFYQLTPDRLQHALWHIVDAAHPLHNATMANRFYDKILAYYRHLDTQLCRLMEKVGPESTVIVVSDHGAGPVTKGFDLTSWLLKEGYIHIKSRSVSQLKFLLWKMGWGPKALQQILLTLLLPITRTKFARKRILARLSQQADSSAWARTRPRHLRVRMQRIMNRLFLSGDDIDWSRSKAYWQMGPGLLRLNLMGREPQGSVRPEDYRPLRDEIADKLRRLIDPTTGQPVSGRVFIKEEIYQGKYTDRMPDIVFVSLDECYVTSHIAFATTGLIFDIPGLSGHHRPDGILLAKGPRIQRGATIEGASILDIAPTVLYLLGSRIPDDMDGHVLTALLDEALVRDRPILYREAPAEGERRKMELSPQDEATVLDRLKGLGYID